VPVSAVIGTVGREDRNFRGGPADNPYPVVELAAAVPMTDARIGMPTFWDEWFPEVARAYFLGGADLLVYPTASGRNRTIPASTPSPGGVR